VALDPLQFLWPFHRKRWQPIRRSSS
jgi:hypothetical protein